jgi:hypothetical protein
MAEPEAVELKAVGAPAAQSMSDSPNMHAILANLDRVHIEQSVNVLEAATCGCCNQKNVYYGYAGPYRNLGKDEQGNSIPKPPVLFTASEESSCLERLCCCGKHGMVLKLTNAKGDVVNTIERPGCCSGKFCLGCAPCCAKCGGCCPACSDCCLDEMNMYNGDTSADPIGKMDQSQLLFNAKTMNCCKTPCKFQTEIRAQKDADPQMIITGPCCFGGCKSLCFDDPFEITDGVGKVGMLKKKAPEDCMACLKEICTDADDFSVVFTPQEGNVVSPEAKLAMVTGAFFADFVIFENDPGACFCESIRKCQCAFTCFNCYVCGAFIPCVCRTRYITDIIFCGCWCCPGYYPCLGDFVPT